jgi:hypothetical protein
VEQSGDVFESLLDVDFIVFPVEVGIDVAAIDEVIVRATEHVLAEVIRNPRNERTAFAADGTENSESFKSFRGSSEWPWELTKWPRMNS